MRERIEQERLGNDLYIEEENVDLIGQVDTEQSVSIPRAYRTSTVPLQRSAQFFTLLHQRQGRGRDEGTGDGGNGREEGIELMNGWERQREHELDE